MFIFNEPSIIGRRKFLRSFGRVFGKRNNLTALWVNGVNCFANEFFVETLTVGD